MPDAPFVASPEVYFGVALWRVWEFEGCPPLVYSWTIADILV